jgi:hypothetical protein
MQALHVINSVKTDPCGNIRRVNVEIPTLSVSDMRRLKATDCVSILSSSSLDWCSSSSSRTQRHGSDRLAQQQHHGQ